MGPPLVCSGENASIDEPPSLTGVSASPDGVPAPTVTPLAGYSGDDKQAPTLPSQKADHGWRRRIKITGPARPPFQSNRGPSGKQGVTYDTHAVVGDNAPAFAIHRGSGALARVDALARNLTALEPPFFRHDQAWVKFHDTLK